MDDTAAAPERRPRRPAGRAPPRARRARAVPDPDARRRSRSSTRRASRSSSTTPTRSSRRSASSSAATPTRSRLFREAGADVDGRAGPLPARACAARSSRRPRRASSPSTRATPSATSRSAARTRCSRRTTARRSSTTSTTAGATATIEDFRNFVKLTYLSPYLHHSGGTVCEPVDVPGQQAPPRHGLRAHPLQRQAVHGLGHGPGARAATPSSWRAIAVRAPIPRRPHRRS